MPITKSAKKRVKQTAKRKIRNKGIKTKLKNIAKVIRNEKDSGKAKELLNEVYSLFDKAVNKGIIHKNNAARKKAQLAKIVREK